MSAPMLHAPVPRSDEEDWDMPPALLTESDDESEDERPLADFQEVMQPHSPPRGPDIEADRSGKAFLKLSPQTRALLVEARSTTAFIAGAEGEDYTTIFDC